MNIDELPFELLTKIFSYLPNHKTVALVNHHFYDVVCTLDAPIMCLGAFPSFVRILFPFRCLSYLIFLSKSLTVR